MYLTNKAQVHFSPGIGLAARPIDPYWPMAMARMFLINYMETMAFAMLAYDAYKVGIPENGETSLSVLVKIPGRVNVYSLRTGKWAIKIVDLAMKKCDFA